MSLFATFQGEARCERLAGEGAWRITGQARGQPPVQPGEPQLLLLAGVQDLDPPALIHDAELEAVDTWGGASGRPAAKLPEPMGWVLRGRDYGRAFKMRSAQLHLGTPPALAAVLAPPGAPWRLRALAWLLLNLARIPGLATWAARRRGG